MAIKKQIENMLAALKNAGFDRSRIEADLNYSENYVDQVLAKGGNNRFVKALEDYSIRMLGKAITGQARGVSRGISQNNTLPPKETTEKPAQTYLQTRRDKKINSDQEIPVFVGSTRAGTIEVYSDDPAMQQPVSHLPADLFPGCNHAEKVSGDSMYPLVINQGFVIGKVIDRRGLIYGEKYVVHTKYWLSMVKYLHEAAKKSHVKLVSYNKLVAPQEVPLDDIIFLCRIYFIVNPS